MAAMRTCPTQGYPTRVTRAGQCTKCRAAAEQRRGTPHQRGYGATHRHRFRAGVLARDPVCVVCKRAQSTVADHWPLSRRELIARGLDPDDPQYGRGLCKRCHDRSTAVAQPGGWNAQ